MGTSTTATRLARPALAIAFWMGVWQLTAVAVGHSFLLASPDRVLARLGELALTADFWETVASSLLRIAIGFTCAAIIGAASASFAAASRVAHELIRPLMAAIRSTPVVSFIIIVLLWTDSGKLAAITSFLMVLPVMYTNVLEGIRNRDPAMLEMASVFRVPWHRRWTTIDIPAVVPYFSAACRSGVGLAWKSGVAAEVIGVASGSIGERMYQAKLFLSSEDLFAWTIVIVVASVACEAGLLLLLRGAERRLPGRFA